MASGDIEAIMRHIVLAVLGSVILVVAVWLAWGIYSVEIAYWALGDIFIPAQAGPWGDSFGPFSALFSALGFTAVLVTLWVQQRQISDAQKDQHRQRFEGSFFELLRFFREARNAVRFEHTAEYNSATEGKSPIDRKIYEGEEAFRAAMREIRHWCKDETNLSDKAKLLHIYRTSFHSRYESKLGPYYRLLYTILQRISADPVLTNDDKATYGNLIRSQLTSHEAAMAGLNGLAPFAKDFSRLVVEFRLLKYVTSNTAKRMLEQHYEAAAFLSRD